MLFVKRPTATTVLYTVSTRAPKKTLTTHAAAYLFVLSRILTGFLVATVLILEYRNSSSSLPYAAFFIWIGDALLSSPIGQFAALVFDSVGRVYRLSICAGLTWLILRKAYTEESLLVIRGLGIQTSTSSPSYLSTSRTRFIPTSHIQDIFIHEAFKGFEVKFYLSIVVEGEEDVVVVFPVRQRPSATVLYSALPPDSEAEHFAQARDIGRCMAGSTSLSVRAKGLNRSHAHVPQLFIHVGRFCIHPRPTFASGESGIDNVRRLKTPTFHDWDVRPYRSW